MHLYYWHVNQYLLNITTCIFTNSRYAYILNVNDCNQSLTFNSNLVTIN